MGMEEFCQQQEESTQTSTEELQRHKDVMDKEIGADPEDAQKAVNNFDEQNEVHKLRKELQEVKEKNLQNERQCVEMKKEMDEMVEERKFLLQRIEQNKKSFDDQLSRAQRKMREQIDVLLRERSELLNKYERLQRRKMKSKVATNTVGTQADFTVDIVKSVPHDDNQSMGSKMSGITFGENSTFSENSNMSGLSNDSKTVATSDTKSIRRHASRILSIARRTIGGSSKKAAVSDLPTSKKKNSAINSNTHLPPKFPAVSKPPISPNPRDYSPISPRKQSSKLKKKDKHSKTSKKSSSKPIFKDTPDDIEFYLPKVSLDGSDSSDGKNINEKGSSTEQNKNNDQIRSDPTALENALRPWQVEFLKSVRITTSSQLVFASKYKSAAIAKAMVKWRAERNMKQMKAKACAVALHIWTRTIEAKIKSIFLERTVGGTESRVSNESPYAKSIR